MSITCDVCTRETGKPVECLVIEPSGVEVYVIEFTSRGAHATCPKCKHVCQAWGDFVDVSPIERRITKPVFGPCRDCNHSHKRGESCVMCGCDGEGWRVVAQHVRVAWLPKVCRNCAAEMWSGKSRAAGRGYATTYTRMGTGGEAESRRVYDKSARTGVKLCIYGCGRSVKGESTACPKCLRQLGNEIQARHMPSPVRTRTL